MSLLAEVSEPLRRYADFRGRSRRRELFLFTVLTWAIHASAGLLASAFGVTWDSAARWILDTLIFAALLSPTIALAVRRLHDTGRAGWWVLLGTPAFAVGQWNSWRRLHDPYLLSVERNLPLALHLLFGAALICLTILLLWDDETEANRYGPNPRFSGSEERLSV